MKLVDILVWVVFVVALVVLTFMRQCTLDVYALVFGFAVAIAAAIYGLTHRYTAK